MARKIIFHELAKCLNIDLRTESKKTVHSIAEYISNEKNLKVKLIISSLKGKCIAFCPELLFGILSPCSYLNIEVMNIISSDRKITEKLSVIPEKMILPSNLKCVHELMEK